MRSSRATTSHIQSLCMDLRIHKQLKPGTIRGIYGTLQMALKMAIRDRKVVGNPASNVTLPKQEKKEMRYLTAEEIEKVIETANKHPRGCLFLIAVVTGMRRNELLALKWEDVDLERGIIQVKSSLSYHCLDDMGSTYKEVSPKTASGRRTILLPAFAVTALRHHRTRQIEARLQAKEWCDLGLVFPNRKGQHQCPMTLHKNYKRFLQKAGIAEAHFHATRHGHATSLLEMGENPRVVQERLGHSDVATTLRFYGHVTPTMQQQAVARLDARFGKV